MKKALVVAGGIPQAALIQELKSRGIYTILADRNPKAYAVQFADAFYPVSTMDVEGIKQLAIKEKVDMVLTACADQVLLIVAQVSEELGLPCYIDYKTAQLVSDKQYMKAVFAENGIPTAKYVVMEQFDDEKLKDFGFPLIVKPVDCYSSRGVRKVQNHSELVNAFDNAICISRTHNAIIEEFVEGKELSVDVYVENGLAHVLCISQLGKIPSADRFVINRTSFPAQLSHEETQMISDTSQKIAEAFGLKNTPMLIQLITTGSKISVLEFCARTGGGAKFRLIKKASGFDVIKAVVDLTLGEQPHVKSFECENRFIVNEFLYCNSCTFDHLEGFDTLLNDGTISEYCQLKHSGAELNEPTCSGDRVAYYTIQADESDKIKAKQIKIRKEIKAIGADGKDYLRHDLIGID